MANFKPNLVNPNYLLPPDNFTNEFSNLNSKEKIKKASEQFEAFFLEEILKEAYKSFASENDFQANMYQDMFFQNIAKVLSEAGGVGFGKFIEKAVEQEIKDQHQTNLLNQEIGNKVNGKA
ncbi:MAG: flagellar biosynthesis protein FlgJ [Hydrogenobaculum sp.]